MLAISLMWLTDISRHRAFRSFLKQFPFYNYVRRTALSRSSIPVDSLYRAARALVAIHYSQSYTIQRSPVLPFHRGPYDEELTMLLFYVYRVNRGSVISVDRNNHLTIPVTIRDTRRCAMNCYDCYGNLVYRRPPDQQFKNTARV